MIYRDGNYHSLLSINKIPKPLEWIIEKDKENKIKFKQQNTDEKTGNRQYGTTSYIPNGAIYIFNSEFLRSSTNYIGDNSYILFFVDIINSPGLSTNQLRSKTYIIEVLDSRPKTE